MVDLDWKAKMVSSENKAPKLSNKVSVSVPTMFKLNDIEPASATSCLAYENYLRLPELRKLWSSRDFPNWKNEFILKPALQALEITFRLISIVLSDPRPYANRREWGRRLESFVNTQIELIAELCEDGEDDPETRGTTPIADLRTSNGVLTRDGSLVWNVKGESAVVSRISEASLLPRLASWQKSEDIANKIFYAIECQMRRCPYTLGLGEPNLTGKPNLQYDVVCKPTDLHLIKKSLTQVNNHENRTLFTTHQIWESWIYVAREVLNRISDRINSQDFMRASSDCWMLEKIWKLLEEIEDLHLLMDPDDFLKLKNQLGIKSEPFCFRSETLIEITKLSKDLKHKVPTILGVEVDPTGGPRIQEAAMTLYSKKDRYEKIHLLQGLQAVELGVKRFFYSYKQLLMIVMGSLEPLDSLTQILMEPTYYPSLDAAKTFLGERNGSGWTGI
ncbi:Nematode resistance protein-like HSPRO1, N-terminal [Dillenia turbinata]|uniref:Nematode resistance protein-like HSPRO1, N-terminal n=1 Tax=Dillenia turbinata TaxID=194707 RepID=A0AAN8V8D4_9MAGN